MATKTYTVKILMTGSDNASKKVGRVGKALSSMGKIIGGILGANLLMKLGQGIKNLGGDAFRAVADFERMSFSLGALLELGQGLVIDRDMFKSSGI